MYPYTPPPPRRTCSSNLLQPCWMSGVSTCEVRGEGLYSKVEELVTQLIVTKKTFFKVKRREIDSNNTCKTGRRRITMQGSGNCAYEDLPSVWERLQRRSSKMIHGRTGKKLWWSIGKRQYAYNGDGFNHRQWRKLLSTCFDKYGLFLICDMAWFFGCFIL